LTAKDLYLNILLEEHYSDTTEKSQRKKQSTLPSTWGFFMDLRFISGLYEMGEGKLPIYMP
jgi:hypothetical protein